MAVIDRCLGHQKYIAVFHFQRQHDEWIPLSHTGVGQCTDGAIRLGGNSTNRVTRDLEGTVEVCALGQWGTIAAPDNSYFGIEEATVVCRQLGLSDRGTYTRSFCNGHLVCKVVNVRYIGKQKVTIRLVLFYTR